jgi:hypothetical protein
MVSFIIVHLTHIMCHAIEFSMNLVEKKGGGRGGEITLFDHHIGTIRGL